jgi:hypothetical protein
LRNWKNFKKLTKGIDIYRIIIYHNIEFNEARRLKVKCKFLFVILLLIGSLAYSFEIRDGGFPLKGLVFDALRMPQEERKNVSITKDTAKILEFTYQGKKYRAEVFVYGAIYLEREGQNPLLISFDIRDYRFIGRGKGY